MNELHAIPARQLGAYEVSLIPAPGPMASFASRLLQLFKGSQNSEACVKVFVIWKGCVSVTRSCLHAYYTLSGQYTVLAAQYI